MMTDRIIEVTTWDGRKINMVESYFWQFASGKDSQEIMMAEVKYLKQEDD